MRKVLKYLLLSLLTLLIASAIINYNLLKYAAIQAYYQIKLIKSTVPISELLQEKSLADSTKNKLLLIGEIKKYAEKQLGLNKTKSYSHFYDQQNKALMYVVSASMPFQLKPYTWHFPIAGTFAYKGFFVKEMAIKEYNNLKQKGYDTRLGSASAWSTLGWLSDPVLSNLLKKSEGEIAETIIHELSHATIYYKDSVDYNENFANFIGVKAAQGFIENRFGANSLQLIKYMNELADQKKLSAISLSIANQLDSLYGTIGSLNYKNKYRIKRQYFEKLNRAADTIQFKDLNYRNIFKSTKLNNAYFLDLRRYEQSQLFLENLLYKKYHGNLKLMIASLKAEQGKNLNLN